MIRVGFVMEVDDGWLGGVNYYRNLLQAIHTLPERKIDPVVFFGRKSGFNQMPGLPSFDKVTSSMLDRHSTLWWVRKMIAKLLKRDALLERLLRQHSVEVLSHSGTLGRGCRLPCICWMADFQHKHMPQFFSEREIRLRDDTMTRWGSACAAIVLSSHDALQDLREFYPVCKARLDVLQFVSAVSADTAPTTVEQTGAGYQIPERYFLVANQFWAHKNHRVLLEALSLLRATGREILIVATGSTTDYRQPGYFAQLISEAEAMGVVDCFKVAGMVPFAHVASLMRNAVAIVNPSLFEGWNTAVEEAKSLGKQVVLSDIAVHREQNPGRAAYFQPHDAAALAELLWERWCGYDPVAEQLEMQKAAAEFPARLQAFGGKYQDIVLQASAAWRASGI